jgi:hypothetical protein
LWEEVPLLVEALWEHRPPLVEEARLVVETRLVVEARLIVETRLVVEVRLVEETHMRESPHLVEKLPLKMDRLPVERIQLATKPPDGFRKRSNELLMHFQSLLGDGASEFSAASCSRSVSSRLMQDISLIPGTLLTLRGFEMQLEMSFINRGLHRFLSSY